jgi:hypothetical protein
VIGAALSRTALRGLSAACICVASACGGPWRYSADPIDAQVVDADTGAPVPDAIVAIVWQLQRATLDSHIDTSRLAVAETATDADGRFHFDGFSKINPRFDVLPDTAPSLYVLRKGYEVHFGSNGWLPVAGRAEPSRRHPRVNGTVIRLKPVGDGARYPDQLSHLWHGIVTVHEPCGWKQVPRLTRTFLEEHSRLRAQQPDNISLIQLDPNLQYCGEVPEPLRPFAKVASR